MAQDMEAIQLLKVWERITMTNDYEDLQRMIDELKAIHKQFLPPLRIERGYEIVGLEIVDIVQDMALEEESEALKK